MGVTKKLGFKQDINNLSNIFKALGHPARIQIMNILLIKNNCTCGEIVSVLPLAQSTVSKHLLELKKANLLNVVNSGKKTIYTIELDKLHVLKKFLNGYISTVNEETDVAPDEKTSQPTTTPKVGKKSKQPKSYLKKYNYQFPNKIENKEEEVEEEN